MRAIPHDAPAQPTAERMLEAFGTLTLTVASFVQGQMTPLSPLQQQGVSWEALGLVIKPEGPASRRITTLMGTTSV